MEGDKDVDHTEAMAADPVRCLFVQTALAARIGWMLSPGPALRLPVVAAAHALPALLITAARHSTELALLVGYPFKIIFFGHDKLVRRPKCILVGLWFLRSRL